MGVRSRSRISPRGSRSWARNDPEKTCWARRGQEERQNARVQCNELTLVKLMELMSQWEFDIDALSLRHAWWESCARYAR